jgi:hypothetical protein
MSRLARTLALALAVLLAVPTLGRLPGIGAEDV